MGLSLLQEDLLGSGMQQQVTLYLRIGVHLYSYVGQQALVSSSPGQHSSQQGGYCMVVLSEFWAAHTV